jgi:hypothetical protein
MKWHIVRGRVSRTVNGTTKARAYYWVRRDDVRVFRVGYYAFNRDIECQGKVFTTLNKARAYCKELDDNTLVIKAI